MSTLTHPATSVDAATTTPAVGRPMRPLPPPPPPAPQLPRVTEPHGDVVWTRLRNANILTHFCRECRHSSCAGEQRNEHERTFNAAEDTRLLSDIQRWRCPWCSGDVRTAPACVTAEVLLDAMHASAHALDRQVAA